VFYQAAGALNTLCVLLGLLGIWLQIRKIRERKHAGVAHPTDILSLNNFATTFCASWSFFVYGYSIEPFNPVLVWPRLASFLLTLVVLYQIQHDRRTTASRVVFITAVVLAAGGLAGLFFGGVISDDARRLSQTLIVAITVLLVQANFHQIALIWRSGKTGAVSLRMNQFFLTMDASGILFGLAMGVASGWPLILLSAASGIPKIIIMWLFRWERVSPLASDRRSTSRDPAPAP
jgi:hypothetical protein